MSFVREQVRANFPASSLLTNPGFESHLSNWFASIPADVTLNTTNPGGGNAALQWVNVTAGNEVHPQGTGPEVPEALRGRACLFRFQARYNSGSPGNFTANVEQNGTTELLEDISIQVNDDWVQYEAGFICPDSGNIEPVFTAEVTDVTHELLIDDVYLGKDFRLGNTIDTAELIVDFHFDDATSCSWDNTAPPAIPAMGDFSAENGTCTIVENQNPLGLTITKISGQPAVTLEDLPAGKYIVHAKFVTRIEGTAGDNFAAFCLSENSADKFNEGACSSQTYEDVTDQKVIDIKATFARTTTGNQDIRITSGRVNAGTDTTIKNNSNLRTTQYIVYRLPTESPRNQVTVETQGWVVDAEITSTADSTTSALVTFRTFAVSDLSLTSSSFSAPVFIDCDNGTPDGADCSTAAVNEKHGIVFTPPRPGVYRACVEFGATHDTANANDVEYRIAEAPAGANNSDVSTRQFLGVTNISIDNTDSDLNAYAIHICSNVDYSDTAQKALVLEYAKSTASGTISWQTNSGSMHWTVYPLTQNFPQAIVTNTVQTGATADCLNGSNICSGTYTPTSSGGSCSSITFPDPWVYTRLGDVVHVAGLVSADCNNGNNIDFDLPIDPAANFSSNGEANGGCDSDSPTESGAESIRSRSGTVEVRLGYQGTTQTGTRNHHCTFTYGL